MSPDYSARSRYSNITEKDIRSLTTGEVIHYENNRGKGFLVVSEVDWERGVVSGKLFGEIYGVNGVPIKEITEHALDIARWERRPLKIIPSAKKSKKK